MSRPLPRWQKTVLIVEDDFDLRHIFADTLSLAGFRVLEAVDGVAALQIIENNPPHLVILDLTLPMLDGLSVRAEMASHGNTRDIPVVVVTGRSGDLDQKLRDDCVLRKPVTPERLVATVRECLAA